MRLSAETLARFRWQERALCAGSMADEYFPEVKPRQAAKRRCIEECPVREQCLAFALDYQMEGLWGGTSTKERRLMSLPMNRSSSREQREKWG